jgi:hypothetical protein
MTVMNSFSFEIGYDWKKGRPKKLDYEMKRYQYDMLELTNTNMNKMVADWLKTLSWMCDYYMNTDYESTSTEISKWSFNYDRSPFISHISMFLDKRSTNDMKNIMDGFYKRSLVSIDQYLKPDKHRFYIYPQSSSVIEKIPQKNKINFPDMLEYVKTSIKIAEKIKGKTNTYIDKKDRVFDCRMCPYFSKCIFKSKHMSFKELSNFNLNEVVEYKILNRKSPSANPKETNQHDQTEKNIVSDKNTKKKSKNKSKKKLKKKSKKNTKIILKNPQSCDDKQKNTYNTVNNLKIL